MNLKTSFKNWLTGANIISERCRPFLDMTDMPLYRGVSTKLTAPFFKVKTEVVRKDRRPRDSTKFAQTLIDNWFQENFGIKPRSQGVFCMGNIEDVKQYGHPAYLFPVGEFKFIWAVWKKDKTPVKDTLTISRQISDVMYTQHEADAAEVTERAMCRAEWHFNEKLKDAQISGAEIVILCDEVILVPVERIEDYRKFIRSL